MDTADKYGRIDGRVGGEANDISGVDVYFSLMTAIIQPVSFFERVRKGNKFLSQGIVYSGDNHLQKTKRGIVQEDVRKMEELEH